MSFYNNDATASNNTALNGIDIQGTANVSNFDNGLRELAAQAKQFLLDLGGGNTVGGSADAITITPAAADTISAAFDGMVIGFVAASDNATVSPTASVGSIGVEPIKKAVDGAETALAAGDIQAGGLYLLRWRAGWDSGNGAWQLLDINNIGVVDVEQALNDRNVFFNSGKVGIGESSPNQDLVVDGKAIVGGNTSEGGYDLQVQDTTGCVLKIQAGSSNSALLALGTISTGVATSIYQDNSVGVLYIYSGSPRITINKSTGAVQFPTLGTTALAANAYLASGLNNQLLRSTSSRVYKRDIEPLEGDYSKALLELQPVWYRSNAEFDNPKWGFYGFVAEDVAKVDPRMVSWGYQAGDYEEIDRLAVEGNEAIPELRDQETGEILRKGKPALEAQYIKDYKLKEQSRLKPDGVLYERFVVHHHVLINELFERVQKLEGEEN